METVPSDLIIIVSIATIVILILWILLPFAVFGTKDKLNQITEELRKINKKIDLIYGKPENK